MGSGKDGKSRMDGGGKDVDQSKASIGGMSGRHIAGSISRGR